MLDQLHSSLPTADFAFENENEDDARVRESARRLFERLNPPTRDRDIPHDAPLLPIYDWEIAGDAQLGLDTVRTALGRLDGHALFMGVVNDEHRVTTLTDH